MKIYKYGDYVKESTVVTIGMFDGVHRGHKLLIEETIKAAKMKNAIPLVYTFYSHPIKEMKRKFLTLLEEKLFLLEKNGIQCAYVVEMCNKFMKLSPEEFFKKEIIQQVNAKGIVVGEDFRFGYRRIGDVMYLKKLTKPFDIDVYSIPLLDINGKTVSSSFVHQLIMNGKIETANALLGYRFFISGGVVKGRGVGRLLGFPTANIAYKNGSKLLPPGGVYVTLAETGGKFFQSVTNVGFNPTFEKNDKLKVEIYFIDVKKNLYGANVRLHFLKKIRDEKKFDKPQGLIEQIQQDVGEAKIYFRLHNFNKCV
ncbi:MAG: bifunctional riboflavin kinase/FAD synthetase [Caldisericota bacterium]|nr:bifunctional riboflavin kinase/FAD synthetase [Caldisericota bacterium]